MKTTQNYLQLIILACSLMFLASCALLKKDYKMSDQEYFNYLRNDSSICKIPEIKVHDSFYLILDTVLYRKKQFKKCLSDPNPYIYTIDIKEQEDTIRYHIECLYSTLNSEKYYQGGFKYKNEIFLVSNLAKTNTDFHYDKRAGNIEVPFCDRIYHPNYVFVATVKQNKICVDCKKNEKIIIK